MKRGNEALENRQEKQKAQKQPKAEKQPKAPKQPKEAKRSLKSREKGMKIGNLLYVSFIAAVLLPVSVVIIFFFTKATPAIEGQVTDLMEVTVGKLTEATNNKILEIKNIAVQLYSNTALINNLRDQQSEYDAQRFQAIREALAVYANSNEAVSYIAIVGSDSEYIVGKDAGSGNSKYLFGDFLETDTYQSLKKSTAVNLVTGINNDYSIVYVMRHIKHIMSGKSLGILTIAIKSATFTNMIRSANLGEGATFSFLSPEGIIVYDNESLLGNSATVPEDITEMLSHIEFHYVEERVTKEVTAAEPDPETGEYAVTVYENRYINDELYKQVFSEQESGFFLNGESLVVYGSSHDGFRTMAVIPRDRITGEIKNSCLQALLLGAVFMVLMLAGSFLIARYISQPLKKMMTVIKESEQGDLSKRVSVKGCYEVQRVSESFNHLMQIYSKLIAQTHAVAQTVSEQTKRLGEVSENSMNAAKQVAVAVDTISADNVAQANDADASVEIIGTLSQYIEEINTSIENMTNAIVQTRDIGNASVTTVDELNQISEQSLHVFDEIKTTMKQLSENMQEIINITQLISSISEQTNLLSLNATIEAARAGEQGRGFAVVAQEVRSLADQSQASIETITKITNGLLQKSEKMISILDKGTETFMEQRKIVEKTGKAFQSMDVSLDDVMEQVSNVDMQIVEINGHNTKATESIGHIAELLDNTASSTSEVQALGEDQVSYVEELNRLTAVLSKEVDELQMTLGYFKAGI